MAVVEANEHAEHASRRIQISKIANSQAASQSTDKSARDQKKKNNGPGQSRKYTERRIVQLGSESCRQLFPVSFVT